MDTITPGDELVFDVFAALAVTFPQADRPRGWPPPSPRPPRRPAVGDDPHKLAVARDMYASKQYRRDDRQRPSASAAPGSIVSSQSPMADRAAPTTYLRARATVQVALPAPSRRLSEVLGSHLCQLTAGNAVRTVVSAGGARPSVPRSSVQSVRGYAFICRGLAHADQLTSRADGIPPVAVRR
jgi:hypothetical protein